MIEKKTIAKNTRTVEKVTLIKVNQREICGTDLRNFPCTKCERRTKINIIFAKVVEHTNVGIKACPSCNAVVKVGFPIELQGPLQYANLQKRYRDILTRAETELPVILDKPNAKRGKLAKSDIHSLWERLKKHEIAVLLFAKKTDV